MAGLKERHLLGEALTAICFCLEAAEQGRAGRNMVGVTTKDSQEIEDHCWSGRPGIQLDSGVIGPSQVIPRSFECTLRVTQTICSRVGSKPPGALKLR